MKKFKHLFIIISLCFITLFVGCSNVSIKHHETSDTNNTTTDSDKKTPLTETFYTDNETTYTDNIKNVDLETLYEKCKKATVTIELYTTYTKQGIGNSTILYSSGSGVITNESENYLYIYTNAHVITVDSKTQKYTIEVILSDYSRYEATAIACDNNEDVAIIRINKPSDSNSYMVAALADSSSTSPGEAVFAIGSPLGIDYASTITTGIVSAVNVAVESDNNSNGTNTTMYLLQTDTAINPGNSGGALFNNNGEVIGINTLKILESESGTSVDGMGFAIPINHFKLVANTIINGDTYSRPQLGISAVGIATLSLQSREKLGITIQNGIYISEVSNSDNTLKANTIITHINSVKVYTFSSLTSELYKYKSGDTVSITYCYVDGSNSNTINITLI